MPGIFVYSRCRRRRRLVLKRKVVDEKRRFARDKLHRKLSFIRAPSASPPMYRPATVYLFALILLYLALYTGAKRR